MSQKCSLTKQILSEKLSRSQRFGLIKKKRGKEKEERERKRERREREEKRKKRERGKEKEERENKGKESQVSKLRGNFCAKEQTASYDTQIVRTMETCPLRREKFPRK